MDVNQKVRIKSGTIIHPDRIGYFQFFGTGRSEGVVVLSTEPVLRNWKRRELFAVSKDGYEVCP